MKYTIRQATTADHDLIYALMAESVRPYVGPIWGWDEDYQRKDFDEYFVPEQFKVVEVEGSFVGFTQVFANSGVTELCEIHLRPEYQGDGIGSDIIKKLLAQAGTVRTGCFKANSGAKALYERIGFHQIEETATHFLFEYSN